MTKRKRLIIVLICALLFLIVTPNIIFYSLGYRIDFTTGKIWATGGIYVRAFPQGVDVIVDSKTKNTTTLFSNSVFVQNLYPINHTVLIQKDGYYDYYKTLKVEEKQVTKLENVTLFRKDYVYNLMANDADYISIAPDNTALLKATIKARSIIFELTNLDSKGNESLSLSINNGTISDVKWSQDSNRALLKINNNYYLLNLSNGQSPAIGQLAYLAQSKDTNFNPQNSSQIFYIKNKNLYLSPSTTPVIKDIVTYKIVNQNIIWLSYDGFVYSSNSSGQSTEQLTLKEISVKLDKQYSIIDASDRVLLKEGNSLFVIDPLTKEFNLLSQSANNIKVSPNNQRVLYFNNNDVSYYGLSINLDNNKVNVKISDFKNIKDCQWLNDDYITCSLADKIIISEIDNRGNVNILNLAEKITLESGTEILMKDSNIVFNQKNKNLYILTQKNLFYSDKILP